MRHTLCIEMIHAEGSGIGSESPAHSEDWDYEYDYFGNRIAKHNNGEHLYYAYDGWDPAKRDSDGDMAWVESRRGRIRARNIRAAAGTRITCAATTWIRSLASTPTPFKVKVGT